MWQTAKKEVVRNAWEAHRKHRWIKAKNRIKTRRVEKRREELLLLSKTTTVVTKKRQRKSTLPPLLLTDFRLFLHRRIGDSCPYSRFFRGRCWWIRWPNRKVTWSRWLCTPVWANFSWNGRRRGSLLLKSISDALAGKMACCF